VNCCTCVLTRRNFSLEFAPLGVVDEEAEGLKLVIGAVSTLKEGRDDAVATGTGTAEGIAIAIAEGVGARV
jgi:hypothetical protein